MFWYLLFNFVALKSHALDVQLPYQDGRAVCQNLIQNQKLGEMGKWIIVPHDYQQPSKKTTELYYWTHKKFNSHLPSVIYFNGGPGASMHGDIFLSSTLVDWNVIYFDQRGVACSRPQDDRMLVDPEFYSSLNTARDAELIAADLDLEKWTVYGHSYGTVPATLAGHLYPEKLSAVILEGVIFDGSEKLWLANHKRKVLQRYFDHLPEETKLNILKYSGDSELSKKVPATWFGELTRYFMYQYDFQSAVTGYLEYLFSSSPEEQIKFINVFGRSLPRTMAQDVESSGTFSFIYLTCKELGGTSELADWSLKFSASKLVPDSDGFFARTCRKMNVKTQSYFKATDYPIEVPVIYVNGTSDGATEAPSAVRHYKTVARENAQLVLVEKSGHFPIKDLIEHEFSALRISQLFAGQFFLNEESTIWNERNEPRIHLASKRKVQ